MTVVAVDDRFVVVVFVALERGIAVDFAQLSSRLLVALLVRFLAALPRALLAPTVVGKPASTAGAASASQKRSSSGGSGGGGGGSGGSGGKTPSADDALRELDSMILIDDENVRNVMIGCYLSSCFDGAARHLIE